MNVNEGESNLGNMADNISDQEQSNSPECQLQMPPSPSSRSIDSGSPLSIEILDSSDEQDNGRSQTRKKGVFQYLEEFHEDLKANFVYRNGGWTHVLVCQFCTLEIPSRSGIIKEHLASRCHTGNKIAAQTLLGFQQQQRREDTPTTGQNQQLLQGLPIMGQHGLSRGQNLIQGLQMGPASTATRPDAASTAKRRPMTSSTITQAAAGTGSVPIRLHIKRNNHNSAMRTMFTHYLEQGQFHDVTLCCEGKMIHCHRIILAAASPYFERVFLEHLEKLPVIFMLNVELWQAEALVKFMYKGETSVEDSKLVPLIRAAKILEIKAMSGFLLPDQIQANTGDPTAVAEENTSNDYEPAGRPVHEVSTATSEPVPQVIINGTMQENVILRGFSPDITAFQGLPSVSYTLSPKKRYRINPAHSEIITTPPIESIPVHPFVNGNQKQKGKSVDTLNLSLTSAPNGNSTFPGFGGHLPTFDEERQHAAMIRDYMRTRPTGEAIDYSTAGVNANTVNQQQRSATATRKMSMPSSSGSEEVQSPEGGGNGGGGEQQPGSGYWMGNIYQQYPEIVNNLDPRQQQADNTDNNGQQQGPRPAMKRKYTRK